MHSDSRVFAGGPRDSHNSIGSIAFPSNSGVQNIRRSVSLFSPATKKKSSLSRETDPLDTSDQFTDDVPDSGQSAGNRTFQEEVVVLLKQFPQNLRDIITKILTLVSQTELRTIKRNKTNKLRSRTFRTSINTRLKRCKRETATMGKI